MDIRVRASAFLNVPVGISSSVRERPKFVTLGEFESGQQVLPTENLTRREQQHLTIKRIKNDPKFRFRLMGDDENLAKSSALKEVKIYSATGKRIIEFENAKSMFQRMAKLDIDPSEFNLEITAPLSSEFVDAKVLLMDSNKNGFDDVFRPRRDKLSDLVDSLTKLKAKEFDDKKIKDYLINEGAQFDGFFGASHGGACVFNDRHNDPILTCYNANKFEVAFKGKIVHLFGCDCGKSEGLGQTLVNDAKASAFIGYKKRMYHSKAVARCDVTIIRALMSGASVKDAAKHARNRYRVEAKQLYDAGDKGDQGSTAKVYLSMKHLRIIPKQSDATLVST